MKNYYFFLIFVTSLWPYASLQFKGQYAKMKDRTHKFLLMNYMYCKACVSSPVSEILALFACFLVALIFKVMVLISFESANMSFYTPIIVIRCFSYTILKIPTDKLSIFVHLISMNSV